MAVIALVGLLWSFIISLQLCTYMCMYIGMEIISECDFMTECIFGSHFKPYNQGKAK